MNPLTSETQDAEALAILGRASVQIVHDLKNQMNGLKLYATFLRKRMEKSERPEDERETIAKLIAGLERAASDMTVLVRFGRPVELRRQGGVDLVKLLSGIVNEEGGAGVSFNTDETELAGAFDAQALSEALKMITSGARHLAHDAPLEMRLRQQTANGGAPEALIEWRGVRIHEGGDPFRSFAGSDGLRMSLAARVVEAHAGRAEQTADTLRVRLPLKDSDK